MTPDHPSPLAHLRIHPSHSYIAGIQRPLHAVKNVVGQKLEKGPLDGSKWTLRAHMDVETQCSSALTSRNVVVRQGNVGPDGNKAKLLTGLIDSRDTEQRKTGHKAAEDGTQSSGRRLSPAVGLIPPPPAHTLRLIAFTSYLPFDLKPNSF